MENISLNKTPFQYIFVKTIPLVNTGYTNTKLTFKKLWSETFRALLNNYGNEQAIKIRNKTLKKIINHFHNIHSFSLSNNGTYFWKSLSLIVKVMEEKENVATACPFIANVLLLKSSQ